MLRDLELPKTFVGSSSEGRHLAEPLTDALASVTKVALWSNGVFNLGESTLEGLIRNAYDVDFAAMVITPDDIVEKRGSLNPSPRDNVLFEAGLFIGRIGRERTFLVTPRGTDLALPSDLLGITTSTYDPGHHSGLSEPASQICAVIKKLGRLGLIRQELVVEVPSSTQSRRRVAIAGAFDKLEAVGDVRTGPYWKPVPMEPKGHNRWRITLTGQPLTSIEYKYVLSPASGWEHVEVSGDGTDRDNRVIVLPQADATQRDTVERWRAIS